MTEPRKLTPEEEQLAEEIRLQGGKHHPICDASVVCNEVFHALCDENYDCYDDADKYIKELRLHSYDLEMLFATFIKYQNEMEEHFTKTEFPDLANRYDFIQLKAKVEAWSKVPIN